MAKKIVSLIMIIIIGISVSGFNYEIYSAGTVDDVVQGAQDFLNQGRTVTYDGVGLKITSDFIFNLLLAIAMVVAVIVGMILGIKFMSASVEEKAKIKESLIPFVVGCVVVFGAFGIWKLAVTILSTW